MLNEFPSLLSSEFRVVPLVDGLGLEEGGVRIAPVASATVEEGEQPDDDSCD